MKSERARYIEHLQGSNRPSRHEERPIDLASLIQRACDQWPDRFDLSPQTATRHEERLELRQECRIKGYSWSEGPRTFSIRALRQKYVCGTLRGPDFQPVSEYECVGGLARELNRRIGTKHGGATHGQAHRDYIRSDGAWHYYFCRPGVPSGDVAYVDLQGAYFAIYSAFPTWDILYIPETLFAEGHTPIPLGALEWLAGHKGARNGLVGVAGSSATDLYMPDGRIVELPAWGCTNYQFSLAVLHILQAVMHQTMERFGSAIHYLNTDGVIVDVALADEVREFWRVEWNLESSVKAQGLAEIRDVGAYRVGDVISGTFHRVKAASGLYRMHALGIDSITEFLAEYARPYLLRRKRIEAIRNPGHEASNCGPVPLVDSNRAAIA